MNRNMNLQCDVRPIRALNRPSQHRPSRKVLAFAVLPGTTTPRARLLQKRLPRGLRCGADFLTRPLVGLAKNLQLLVRPLVGLLAKKDALLPHLRGSWFDKRSATRSN